MNILAIDTSTDYLSLAIMKNEKIPARIHKKAGKRHSILLVPMIDKLLRKVGLKITDIDCFAISAGPGSFTGLRIGITVVKGFAYVLKKPIVTVPTLDVIANNISLFKGVICVVLDARKNKVYGCFYKSDGKTIKKITKHLLLPMDGLLKKAAKYDNILFLGDKAKGIKDWHPRAEIVARMGAEEFKKRRFTSAEDLEPLYLYSRECDVTGK